MYLQFPRHTDILNIPEYHPLNMMPYKIFQHIFPKNLKITKELFQNLKELMISVNVCHGYQLHPYINFPFKNNTHSKNCLTSPNLILHSKMSTGNSN